MRRGHHSSAGPQTTTPLRALRRHVVDGVKRIKLKMDVTKLNIFQWCKFLRHLGRTIMFSIVCAIIALAGFATFDSVLVPGMRADTPSVQIGYAILATIYSCVVSTLLCGCLCTQYYLFVF